MHIITSILPEKYFIGRQSMWSLDGLLEGKPQKRRSTTCPLVAAGTASLHGV